MVPQPVAQFQDFDETVQIVGMYVEDFRGLGEGALGAANGTQDQLLFKVPHGAAVMGSRAATFVSGNGAGQILFLDQVTSSEDGSPFDGIL